MMIVNVENSRTIIGNRIDQSLARGLVRRILEDIKRADENYIVRKFPHNNSSTKSRQRFMKYLYDLLSAGSQVAIAVQDNKFFDARIWSYSTHTREDDGSIALSVVYSDIDLRNPDRYASRNWEHWPIREIGLLGSVTQHSLERIVQRAGVTTKHEVFEILKPVWSWANLMVGWGGVIPRWAVATEAGLFWVAVEKSGSKDVISTPITFMPRDDLSLRNRDFWNTLVDAGSIALCPKRMLRFPEKKMTPETLVCTAAMIDIGMASGHAPDGWQSKYINETLAP